MAMELVRLDSLFGLHPDAGAVQASDVPLTGART